MGKADKQRARIVDFWRAVELFEPQGLPKIDERSEHSPTFRVRPGLPLPWQKGHPLRERPRQKGRWRHTVYCGVYSLVEVRDLLDREFGAEVANVDQHRPGDSALVAFEVDEQGRALLESDVVSSCGWAVGRTLSPGHRSARWLEGFQDTQERFRTLFEWLVTEPGPGPTKALLTLVDGGGLFSTPVVELWDRLSEVISGLELSASVAGSAEIMDGVSVDFGAEASRPAEQSSDSAPGDPPAPTVGAGTPQRRRRELTEAELDACLRTATRLLGIGDELRLDFRVHSRLVPEKEALREEKRQAKVRQQRAADRGEGPAPEQPPEPAESPFLNSFIADDLQMVADRIRKGEYGHALRSYLASVQETAELPRCDVRAEGAEALSRVAPHLTPLGRWPGKDTHPLVLSQQIAVNTIVERLDGSEGLCAVNGPPGTGKTTLLRDLIAHVVVQRAHELARLRHPADAFERKTGWQTERQYYPVYPLCPSLRGHEIVVASSNNGAVDNVTTEIPALESIDDTWHGKADYFADVASNVLGRPAWGTLAARLGKKSNRMDFAQRFWWGGAPNHADGTNGAEQAGMRRPLQERRQAAKQRNGASGSADWTGAVRVFTAAVAAATKLREQRSAAQRALQALPGAREQCVRTRAETERARETRERSRIELAAVTVSAEEATAKLGTAQSVREQHWTFKPGLLDILFSLGRRLREWQHKDDALAQQAEEAERLLAAAAQHHDQAKAAAETATDELRFCEARLGRAEEDLSRLEKRGRDAVAAWGAHVPSAELRMDEQARELSAPWADPELNRARTEVFLAALDLHRAFVEAAPQQMYHNLGAAMSVLAGEVPSEAPRAAVQAALRSLFLVVPVVSTTFASFSRLFEHFGRESLGWLLVDEAGQATPQQAVGALWRSRRAVVVGDPMQLEPICTLPFTAQQTLREKFGAEQKWVPAWGSVQSLADEATPLGTWINRAAGDPVWVGSPLRVHRRCDDPMFGISNRVGYDGMMVFGTPKKPNPGLARSHWIDVSDHGAPSRGHWIPAEGAALHRLLRKVREAGHDMHDVFVLTPFRDVARNLHGPLRDYDIKTSGTVHTAQGKEAGVVILVLGGEPERTGARQWASKKPNMVNVAVSRAKRRLYVIGNHGLWADLPHFTELAEVLPVYSAK